MLFWRLCSSVSFSCIQPECTSGFTEGLLIWILFFERGSPSKGRKPSNLSSFKINSVHRAICHLDGTEALLAAEVPIELQASLSSLCSWDPGIVSICGPSILWNARGSRPQTAFHSLTVSNLLQRHNSLDMCAICMCGERWTLRCLSWYLPKAFLNKIYLRWGWLCWYLLR